MESGHGKMRMNAEDDDRLSNLSDDLIHKILSLVGIKLVVQTSALSSRWRYLWTSLPCLNFSIEDFKTLPKFSKFVTHILSCRNIQIEVSSAKLSFHEKASQAFVKKILNYAFSYNVKQLTVSCLSSTKIPLSLFSSQSLKHLTSLTTLHLEYIKFNNEVTAKDTGFFSKFVNLKKLVLKDCRMITSNGVDICHPGLSNLTLENGSFFENVTNVVAPRLKNLSVRSWEGLHLISAPELVSLRFEGLQSEWLKFSSYELCSLENLDLCITKDWSYKPDMLDAHTIFDILHQCHSVKYLTLNLEIFEEMKALKNAESALNCMAELGEMLEHEKANIETNIAHLDQFEICDQIDSYWKDLSAQIKHGKSKTSSIVLKLCHIEELVTELPASKRAQIVHRG